LRQTAFILLIFNTLWATAQLVEVPIAPVYTPQKNKSTNARTQALPPLPLPFWDDFSFRQTLDYPNDTLWENGKSVWVNHGRAINPPSIYTATFDGIDSTGKPYSVNDLLAKGFADRLVSRALDLGALTPIQEDKVYLSFFYQTTGFSESPDRDDNLSLWFKGKTGNWEKVFEVANSRTLQTDSFYYAIVKVEPDFQHSNFQFRFQNFGRLSGPYDCWNLDYIYINANRAAADDYFPDRTQVKPFTSIFKRYQSMPMKHFRDTAAYVINPPTAVFRNLFEDIQPSEYSSYVSVQSWKNETQTSTGFFPIDFEVPIGNELPAKGFLTRTLDNSIPIASIPLDADSARIDFSLGFDSGDDILTDIRTQPFIPIQFIKNDSSVIRFTLKDYYAYDDGTAEYGAGLNRAGSNMAYWFPMFTKDTATVVAVKLHFPQFGDAQNRTVVLKLWSTSSDGKPQTELTQQTITVQRSTYNEFITVPLEPKVKVQGSFFIGWQQTANTLVPVGLDKNTDSGDDIYFNIAGTWEQNQNVRGSLMIRPVFGEGDPGGTTGLEPLAAATLYPNPSSGKFTIPVKTNDIQILNAFGVTQNFQAESTETQTQITLTELTSGLYLVRWRYNGNLYTSRILLRLN
jgi:hypothetical protein